MRDPMDLDSIAGVSDASGCWRMPKDDPSTAAGFFFASDGYATAFAKPGIDTDTTVVTLHPGAKLTIRVMDANGLPMARSRFLLSGREPSEPASRHPIDADDIVFSGTTDDNGEAIVERLSPGILFLRCHAEGHLFYDFTPPVIRVPAVTLVTVEMRPLFGVAVRLVGHENVRSFSVSASTCTHLTACPSLDRMTESLTRSLQTQQVALLIPKAGVRSADVMQDTARVVIVDDANHFVDVMLPIQPMSAIVPHVIDTEGLAKEPSSATLKVDVRQPDGSQLDGSPRIWLRRADGLCACVTSDRVERCPPGEYEVTSQGWMRPEVLPPDCRITVAGTTEFELRLQTPAYLTKAVVVDDRGVAYDTASFVLRWPNSRRHNAGVITTTAPFAAYLPAGDLQIEVRVRDLAVRVPVSIGPEHPDSLTITLDPRQPALPPPDASGERPRGGR